MEISLSGLMQWIDGRIAGNPHVIIKGVAPFHAAASHDITFADSPKLLKKINDTKAAAVIVPEDFAGQSQASLILCKVPRLAFAKALNIFCPDARPAPGISPLARIGRNFSAGRDAYIAPSVVIDDNVRVGDRAVIRPHVYIGEGVIIGDDADIFPNVSIIKGCVIGNRVVIQSGSVIGSDGFGFAPDGHRHVKIPQKGIVQIDDDVEIGANCTIDRATFGKTWIQQGVKTDNLVHIAHNVVVGENTLIVGQVGIAGSTTIGKNVILAGQAGISGHLSIGDHAVIGPQAGVVRSVSAGEVVSGSPQMPHKIWLRVHQILTGLPELKKKVIDLEKRLSVMEEQSTD
ncbi:MAG: UDP-3-O-(3-hydroxymyristoyl)glucosamine N-acyltransferase [Desulfobacterales bacterium]|jgi:UDP-3-O-[3-hydroxymyristoyl] glucosamine N-acyltransferase|nr:UDP-3-O-(3-hydroxymyristoyl)glucosamine N-acyltransferase [Desulfobacterales bacterium]